MKELIIYDTTGYIYFQMASPYRVPIGIPFLEVDIPEGKMVTKIDVTQTPNIPVFENIPLSDAQKANIQTTTLLKALIQ